MESSQVSWQVENVSSAELVSPPISPSPPSPSLYNGVGSSGQEEKKVLSTRAVLASTILNELEQQAEFNDFGMNWNEESVNLNLFEELEEVEYTPPTAASFDKLTLAPPSPPFVVVEPTANFCIQLNQPYHRLNSQASESSADITTLTAEFQAILDSLPKDSEYNGTDALSHVLHLAGIPTTIVDGEALVPVELDLSSIGQHPDLQCLEEMELDDLNVISENEEEIVDESELYELSNQGSPASSIHSIAAQEQVDVHSAAAEKILDALLVGDVETAETFLPQIMDEASVSSCTSSEDSYFEEPVVAGPSSSPAFAVVEKKKEEQERRNQKPKNQPKKSLKNIKDKTLRKKEQNKTAATRYRQKKKAEFAIILETEAELQKTHDELDKKKEDLNREILMVKQLLREIIRSKKPETTSLVSRSGSQLIVSNSSIGRTTHRRK